MKTYSKKVYRCVNEAMQKGYDLMPDDCIEILEKEYGIKLKQMKPTKMFDIMWLMMGQASDNPDKEAINDTIYYYFS